jgi:hypothetical protein
LPQLTFTLAGVPNNNINLNYLEHPGYVELVGLNTCFQSEQEFNHLQLASLISTRDTGYSTGIKLLLKIKHLCSQHSPWALTTEPQKIIRSPFLFLNL